MRRVPLVVGALAALVWCGAAWAPPREADLRVTLTAVPPRPVVGQAVVWSALAQNKGPDSALDVVLTDRLPEGVTLLRASASQGSCTGTRVVTCALGLMGRFNQAFDAKAAVRLVVRVDAEGALTNHAAVAAASLQPELIPENDAADSTVTASAAASTASDVLVDVVSIEKTVVTVRVTNLGPQAARDVVVAGRRVGTLELGDERRVVVKFKKVQPSYAIVERHAGGGTTTRVFRR